MTDFNERSDNAASQLKQAMGLPESKVTVDANGNPPAQPPGEGTYARAAHDEVVAAQARINQAEQAQQAQPPVPDQPTPREQFTPELSEKAEARIKDLVDKLRDKDQAFQQLQASNSQSEAQIAELRGVAEQLQANQAELMAAQLENLSPEERAQVVGNAQVNQAVQAAEQRILSQLQPALATIGEQTLAREYEAVAAKFPDGFDPRVHPELISHFRSQNPNCSVELAFKAVASLDELGVGSARPANPIPPSLAPSHSGIPKSVPTQQVSHPHADPNAEVAEEASRAYALMRSNNHNDHKAGMKAIEANLKARLFGAGS